MDILVVHASKHGSTVGIAQTIAARLIERGHAVTIFDAESAEHLDGAQLDRCGAFVVGSAIYAGHWLKPARRFIDLHARILGSHPLWLFSSGPLGDPPHPADDSVEVRKVAARLHARGHEVFAGALDPRDLNRVERTLVKVTKSPTGDFRDTDEIQRWADEIADALG